MSNWKKLLLNYFLVINDEDKNIEKNRKFLCENENFVPIQLFKKLDNNRKNKLTLNDFKKYFFDNAINYEEKFLRKFIHIFDKSEKFSINFNEFLALILPKENDEILNEILKREENNNNNNENKIDQFFLNILEQELNLIKNLYEISQKILNSKNFVSFEGFTEIAENDKFITTSNMRKYFSKNSLNFSEREIETIIFRLDSNNDKKVSYQEYLEIFFPSKFEKNNSSQTNNSEQSNFSYNIVTTTNNVQNSLKNSKNLYSSENYNLSSNLYFPKSEKLTNNLFLSQNNSNNKVFSLTSPRKEEFQSFFNKNFNHNNYSLNGNNVLQTSISNLIKSPTFSPNRSQIKNDESNNIIFNNKENENKTKISIFNLLCDFIEKDISIENRKDSFSFKKDINLTDLFEFFTNENKISSVDFLLNLKRIGLNLKNDEIEMIFKKYNKNSNEFFNFDEFCDFILPKKYSIAKYLIERKPKKFFSGFDFDSKKLLKNFFVDVIQAEKSNNFYRKNLAENCDKNDCFKIIAKKNYNFIEREDFIHFLQTNGKFTQPFEINLLFERFDKNNDGIVSFEEFIDEIQPKFY